MVIISTVRVFLSHSSKDRQTAEQICSYLEKSGKLCWIAPRNIPAGAEYGEEIIKGIENSDVMVLVFSAASNASQHVLREIERAVNKRIPIIAVRLENCELSKSLEYFLLANQWLDATSNTSNMPRLLSESIDGIFSEKSEKTDDLPAQPVNNVHVTNKAVPILLGVIAAGIITAAVIICVQFFGGYNDKPAVTSASKASSETPAATEITEESTASAETTAVSSSADTTAATLVSETTTISEEPAVAAEATSAASVSEEAQPSADTSISEAVQPVIAEEAELPQFKVGDYITYGRYCPTGYSDENDDDEILWQIVDISGDTATLVSAEIIDIKPFDCAESGKFDDDGNGSSYDRKKADEYSSDEMKLFRGSNDWSSSDIRAWLNSTGNVKYVGEKPADKATDECGNAFGEQKGFLSLFTENELKLLCGNPDSVFLLSVDEAKQYSENGAFSLHTTVTKSAATGDETSWYSAYVGNGADDYIWATRTPSETNAHQVYVVDSAITGNDFALKNAAASGLGIRPAVIVDFSKEESIVINGGGSLGEPYAISY